LIGRLRDEMSVETVLTAYGLTESTGTATMCRQGDSPETIATTSGRAIPDTEVQVVDTDGKAMPTGEPGEVVVRGYNVMQGYFEDPEATAQTIDAGGWLHTGDIGVMDADGNLTITDRLKDMYVVGGFNAYPAEVEQMLARYPGIAECAVIGVPDERLGEVGHAFVVARPEVTLDAADIVSWCREQMANYKAPRTVQLVNVLPRNASGKVLKFELRQLASPSS
jgi:acyl-CoA synthetase (AMP-forming)/AMP-acid ligase II